MTRGKSASDGLASSAGGLVARDVACHPAEWRRVFSTAGGHLQLGANVQGDLGWIEINEVADAVVGDAAEFGPIAQGANRRLATLREKPAGAEAGDVGEVGER
jgi:hypothetical protein